MLEVFKKRGLKDMVVVVMCYFGGIKLGVGGLVCVYGKFVFEVLNELGIVKWIFMVVMYIIVDYIWFGKLENEFCSFVYLLKEIYYVDMVEIEIFVEEV